MAAVHPALVETCTAPSNIACIKYWGKDSVALNTPINSSVSVTLDQRDLRAVTTVCASKDFATNQLWLNGKEEPITDRFKTCLLELQRMAGDRVVDGTTVVKKEEWCDYRVHVVSVNTFPTAAGLASSAAGYACLVYSLAQLYCVTESYVGELSTIARQGSGSACRSLYGGFVRWQKGEELDASDSMAVQVASESHWPELRALVLVASAAKKKVSSTDGMQGSVATSKLLAYRAAHVVPERVAAIEEAFLKRDFATFGDLTMADSNQFHATCLDSYPPIFYLNDVSRDVIRAVHAYNEHKGEVVAAYTFDAGPNAVIYTTEAEVPELLATLMALFPPPAERDHQFTNAPEILDAALEAAAVPSNTPALSMCIDASPTLPREDAVTMVLHTRMGPGPVRLTESAECCLVDMATGQPSGDAQAIAYGAVGDSLARL